VSVRGEFVRIAGDAIARLQALDSAPARALASDLEQARDAAVHDLSGAAGRVLALLDGSAFGSLARELDDDGERLLAISKVILGR